MTNDIVLSKLDKAYELLAEADIYQTKNILDMAVAAETYAKRQKMSEDSILRATSIKVEALRQLGNMLKDAPKQTAAYRKGGGSKGAKKELILFAPPTLADMGLDKKTSKLAQDIASLPEEQIEKVKRGVSSIHEAQKNVKAARVFEQRIEMAALGKAVKPSDRWNIFQGDIETWKPARQYDFIITDPPYPKEYLHLYETLAQKSSAWLKNGGLLVAMCGQSYVNDIYAMMSKHLTYYWTAAYLTPGQPTPLRQVNVNSTWKPLLIFRKGEYKGKIFGDVFVSDGNDKSMHKWGQSESGMYSIISKMCLEGQSILDPFCGAGTTGIAALQHGCFFDGIEKEKENVEISMGRLAAV